MKCILHIGTEKTGTTTLQHFLHANKLQLEKQGYGVLNSVGKGNNRRLANYAMRNNHKDDYSKAHNILTEEAKIEYDKETKTIFENEINSLKDNCHTIIITSEHFHSRCIYDDEVEKLKSLLDIYFDKIEVIVYLRPQIDVAISLYTTILRSGGASEFTQFLSKNCNTENEYYNYDSLLQRWSKTFGRKNVFPKIFDPKLFIEGDLIKDFLGFISIVDIEILQFFNNANESLTPFGQELLRLNNLYNQTDNNNKSIFSKDFIYQKTNELFVGKGCTPSQEEAEQIQEQFKITNQKVSKKWFNKDELFILNYDKYKKIELEKEEKNMLKNIFYKKDIELIENIFSTNGVSAFSKLNTNLKANSNSADILRDVALSFESINDIQTAQRIMYQAYLLRPNGPFIKQKLEEYTNLVQEKNASIPPEGIETINKIGHREYVGGFWNEIGKLQFDFMVAHGLKPHNVLLDIACGSLRAGVHFINYLEKSNYLGLDQEKELIIRGVEEELTKDKEIEKQPQFIINSNFDFTNFSKVPDYAIAQSLFTHLVEKDIIKCLKNLKSFIGNKQFELYATFFECDIPQKAPLENSHTHVKFDYTKEQMEQFAKDTGWKVRYIGNWNHPRGQKMMKYYIKGQK